MASRFFFLPLSSVAVPSSCFPALDEGSGGGGGDGSKYGGATGGGGINNCGGCATSTNQFTLQSNN